MIRQNIFLAVDIVLFSKIDKKTNILLIKRKHEPFLHQFALPGGFVETLEPLKVAAYRELKEETNIENINLKMFEIYDDPIRDPRGRVVSVVFVGQVDIKNLHMKAGTDAIAVEWMDLDEIKKTKLAFDHNKIIKEAIDSIK